MYVWKKLKEVSHKNLSNLELSRKRRYLVQVFQAAPCSWNLTYGHICMCVVTILIFPYRSANKNIIFQKKNRYLVLCVECQQHQAYNVNTLIQYDGYCLIETSVRALYTPFFTQNFTNLIYLLYKYTFFTIQSLFDENRTNIRRAAAFKSI